MRLPTLRRRKHKKARSEPRPRRSKFELLEARRVLATVTWTGGGGDNLWSDAANWSSAPNLPGATDDVVISVPAGVTITHASGNDSIHSLLSANAFNLAGGTLTVSTTVEVDNTFTMSGGTLADATVEPGSGGQGITFGSASTRAGGTLDAVTADTGLDMATYGPEVYVSDGLTLNNATLRLGSSTAGSSQYGSLIFTNNQTLGGTGTVILGSNSNNSIFAGYYFQPITLTIAAGITVRGSSATIGRADFPYNDPNYLGTIVNQGTISADASGGGIDTIDISAQGFTNDGTLSVSNGEWLNVATYYGQANVSGNLGTAIVSGSGSHLNLDGAGFVVNAGLSAPAGTTVTLGGTWSNAAGSTISADGGVLNLGDQNGESTNAWSNSGTITATNGSTVNLGGGFTRAGLGSFTRSADCTVNLTGILDDTGTTLALNAATGSWNLDGGTIKNGTLSEADGAELFFKGGTLDGVTADSDLDMATYDSGVTIADGLTLNNATLRLGGSSGSTWSALTFTGNETLGGTGTVLFGASSSNTIYAGDFGWITLTIGPGIVVKGTAGSLTESADDYQRGTIVNEGTISADGSGGGSRGRINVSPMSFVNEGTLSASNGEWLDVATTYGYGNLSGSLGKATVSGTGTSLTLSGAGFVVNAGLSAPAGTTLTLGGAWSNAAGSTISATGAALNLGDEYGWSNAGTISAANGSTVNLGGDFTVAGLGSFSRDASTTVNVTGTLDDTGATLALNAATGSWNLRGGTIKNGALSEADGAELLFFWGTLDGVTANSDLDMATNSATINIADGLTLNGATLRLGNSSGSASSTLDFMGNETIGGTGTVLFGASSGNTIYAGYFDWITVTIGPGITIKGTAGTLGPAQYINERGTFVNQGTISADGSGGGSRGTIYISSPGFYNDGTIAASNGESFNVGYYNGNFAGYLGTATVSGSGSSLNLEGTGLVVNDGLSAPAGTTVTLSGTWSNAAGSTISADGGVLNLGDQYGSSTKAWSNAGTISATNGSTVSLGGDFTVAGLGSFARDASTTVNVTGVLDNTRTTLALNDATGSWILNGGTIKNGTLTETDGAELYFKGGTLDGVTADSDLDMATYGSAVYVADGLTLNNTTLSLGNESATTASSLIFAGNETLGGTGTVLFGASAGNTIYAGEFDWITLTIGPGIVVKGTAGTLTQTYYDYGRGTIVNEGTISADGSGGGIAGTINISSPGFYNTGRLSVSNGEWLNVGYYQGNFAGDLGTATASGNGSRLSLQGTGLVVNDGLSAPAGTTITLSGTWTNAAGSAIVASGGTVNLNGNGFNQGTLDADAAGAIISVQTNSFSNQGNLLAVNGGTLALPAIAVNGAAGFTSNATGTIEVAGNLSGATTTRLLFTPSGTTILNETNRTANAPQFLEAMSADQGATDAGFKNNFAYGNLTLAPNAYVTLVDQSRNSTATTPEALYANQIVVPAGATLDLSGYHAYARAAQVNGTVLNGSIDVIPTSGTLSLASPVPGDISTGGQLEQWSFFDRAGHTVAVLVDPGSGGTYSPIAPQLEWAQAELLDSTGHVLATATNGAAGGIVSFDVTLPTDGSYRIQVTDPSGHSAATGNYQVGVWDVTPNVQPLLLNQQANGNIATPFAVDQWTFSAAANQQISFVSINTSAGGMEFTLTGPDGSAAFSNVSASTGLITLGKAGTYTLSVSGINGATGAYAFEVNSTTEVPLNVGDTYNGQLSGPSQAFLFDVGVTDAQSLLATLADSTASDVNELYAKFGAPPTPQNYDYRYSTASSANQSILIPKAAVGHWYFLVYTDAVANLSNFTFTTNGADLRVTSVSPTHSGNGLGTGIDLPPLSITVTGSGFVAGTIAELVAASGTTFAASQVTIISFTQLTATFPMEYTYSIGNNESVIAPYPAGAYTVQVQRPGSGPAVLSNGFTVDRGGAPQLFANIVVPNPIGYHIASTIYVKYANKGDVPMPAPLLLLTATMNGQQGALMTLDPSKVVSGYWTSSIPEGYSTSVSILASGATPGVLEPGESEEVPVYYAGWLQNQWDFTRPKITFSLAILGRGTHPQFAAVAPPAAAGGGGGFAAPPPPPDPGTLLVGWSSLESSLQPPNMTSDAWSAIYPALTTQMGARWNDYVAELDADANYLANLGENVRDISTLWQFEIAKANGLTADPQLASSSDISVAAPGLSLDFSRVYNEPISSRYTQGILGYGWATPWQTSLSVAADGTVTVNTGTGGFRMFQPDSRHPGQYFSLMGDTGVLTLASDGDYLLRELNGQVTAYLPDGRLDYVADANGNRITAGYTGAQLISLTHSSGQSLTLAYNSAGLVASVTSSDGRQVLYSYDSNNQLIAVQGYDGQTTGYSYLNGQGAPLEHALSSIAYAAGNHEYFSYNATGQLTSTSGDGGAGKVSYRYGAGGQIFITDANNNSSEVDLNQYGMAGRSVDALGNITTADFNSSFQLTQIVAPDGTSLQYSYNSLGQPVSITDGLHNTVELAYGGADNGLTSVTDANGSTTQFQRDQNGNLLSTVYANGTSTATTFDPLGDALSFTNARGQTIGYQRNSAGQITQELFSDGSKTSFTYNPNGTLASATDSTGTTTFSYDSGLRLTKVSYPDGRWLAFRYNANGQRVQLQDNTGFTVAYQYDGDGRLYKLLDRGGKLIVQYTYDDASRLIRKDMGNGTYTTYQYDADNNLLLLTNYAPGGTVNSQFAYTYNDLGQRVTETTINGTWTYSYDADGQLVHAAFTSTNPAIANQDLQYEYDAAGNRTSTIVNGVSTSYVTNNVNEYTSVGSTSLGYDASGNLVSEVGPTGTTTMAYNDQNQLVSVVTPTDTWSFEYDPFGNLIATVHNGQRVENLVDPAGLGYVDAAFDGSGNLLDNYSYGLGLASQVPSGGTAGYYDFDAIGSTAGISGSDGAYVNSYSYLPFGGLLSSQESVANPFQFVGEGGIATAGSVDLMRARGYDTTEGRFLSLDPLSVSSGQMNLYEYVSNRPTALVDPTGMFNAIADQPVPPLSSAGCDITIGAAGDAAVIGLGLVVGAPWDIPIALAGTALPYSILTPGGDTPEHESPSPSPPVLGDPLELPPYDPRPPYKGPQFAPQVGSSGGDGSCGPNNNAPTPNPPNDPNNNQNTNSVNSHDPNDAMGPAGYGAQAFVAPSDILPYRIDFENSLTASAPAQSVTVSDPLDPNLDPSTFQLSGIGWGDVTLSIPPGSQQYQTSVDMNYNNEPFEVDVSAGIDLTTNTVYLHVESIDPATSLPPDVLTGFLPPEDGTGRGMGYLTYTVEAKAGLSTGTQTRNVALITFDANPPIATDQVNDDDPTQGVDPSRQDLITIDSGAPTSSVGTLPAFSSSTFTVSWSGSDDTGGSGIASYDIWISDDGGPVGLWLLNTTDTSATFTGQIGHTYGFYSVATDNVGNVQATPTAAQATTEVGAAITATATAITATEGVLSSDTVATFTDSDANDTPSATITWEDGSMSIGVISGPDANGVYTVTGSHAFADETSGATVSVTISSASGATATAVSTVTVSDAPLTGSDTATAGGTEGATLSSVLSDAIFVDANPGDHLADMTATITWGDNTSTSPGTVSYNSTSGLYTVGGSHTYAEEGSWPLNIVVNDAGGSTTTITGNATVADAPLTPGTVAATVGTEGVVTSALTATFSDANAAAPTSDFSGTINWGDGTAADPDTTPFTATGVSGSGGNYTINASHPYAEEGRYTVTVLVNDVGGSKTTVTGTATVDDAPLTAGTATATVGTEGVLSSTLTATFSDANTAASISDFSGTINWGDGTAANPDTTPFASGAVFESVGNYTINASHQYAEEGTYPIALVVGDDGGQAATITGAAKVADAPLTVGPNITVNAVEGLTVGPIALATFTDVGGPESQSDYGATIDWGDGTSATTAAILPRADGSFSVEGSHLYGEEGSYTVSVAITHENGITANATAVAAVTDNVALLLLDPTSKASLNVTGNGQVALTGGGAAAIVNSASAAAVRATGNAKVAAGEIDVAGSPGVSTTGNATLPSDINSGVAAMADPFGGLSVEAPSTSYAEVSAATGQVLILEPGAYLGGISVSGGSVTLLPGVYYLEGGGLKVSGGSLMGQGVLVYNEPQHGSKDAISIAGQGTVDLIAPTSGPYQGFALVQDPSSNAPINVTGGGLLSVTGVIYAAGASLNVSGNAHVQIDGSASAGASARAVVYDASVSGGGVLSIDAGQNAPLAAGAASVGGASTLSNASVFAVSGQPLVNAVVATSTALSGSVSYAAAIDWGDGSPVGSGFVTPTAAGQYSVAGSHTYTITGTYQIAVTVGGSDGNLASSLSTAVISDTALEPDPTNSGGIELAIGGTTADDTINIAPGATVGSVVVTVSNTSGTVTEGPFAPTGRVVVYGQSGNDVISIASGLTLPGWVFTGDGNNDVTAGGGPSVLVGGSGNDTLTAGSGRDILIGGQGADSLVGSGGDDLMIAGTTAYDANDIALAAILAEWDSADSLAVRMADLSDASPAANRSNGNYFLIASGANATVFDDTSVDTLVGGSGNDWLFGQFVKNASTSAVDVVNAGGGTIAETETDDLA